MNTHNPAQALLPASTVAPAGKARVAWIDIARGGAIVLVVLFHSYLAARLFLGNRDGLLRAMLMLREFRMPIFFFCSGILAHWGLNKPWSVVIRRRIVVLGWVIVVWTLIYFVVQALIPFDPWRRPQEISQILIVPFGNLWFVYAIAFLSIVMRLLMGSRLVFQLLAIAALNLAFFAGFRASGADPQYALFFANLASYAIVYFAAGFWLAPLATRMFASRRRILALGALACPPSAPMAQI